MHSILYLNKSAEIGGSEISLLLLLKYINKAQYRPLVALPLNGPLVERINELGVRTITTPLNNINHKSGNPIPYLSTVWNLVKVIRRERIDLVCSNNEPSNQYGAVAARLCGVPIVCHLRDMVSRAAFRQAFLKLDDRLIANSQAVAESYLQWCSTPEKIDVIFNGVDLEDYQPLNIQNVNMRKQWNIPNGTFLLGIAGRIQPSKGHHILIQSLAKVNQASVDYRLAIIGPTESTTGDKYQLDLAYLNEIKQMIQKLGLEKKVVFCGKQRAMPPVYNAIDLLVLPSFEEPFGRSLIEAMAMVKPTIATAVGGPLEIVENGKTGLLAPPGDTKQLADAILKLACDRDLAQRMGGEGRKRVERLFKIETHMLKIHNVYEQILTKGTSSE